MYCDERLISTQSSWLVVFRNVALRHRILLQLVLVGEDLADRHHRDAVFLRVAELAALERLVPGLALGELLGQRIAEIILATSRVPELEERAANRVLAALDIDERLVVRVWIGRDRQPGLGLGQ
jgi:hypothetical protein